MADVLFEQFHEKFNVHAAATFEQYEEFKSEADTLHREYLSMFAAQEKVGLFKLFYTLSILPDGSALLSIDHKISSTTPKWVYLSCLVRKGEITTG